MSLSLVLKELQMQVGKEIHLSEWLSITQDRINDFARATGDCQWIHIDSERAKKESPYGDTVAHGYLLVSLIPFLTQVIESDKTSYAGAKSLVNYGSNKVRFVHPVFPEQRIRSRTTLLSVDEINNALQVSRKVILEIEGISKPACVAEVLSRVFF